MHDVTPGILPRRPGSIERRGRPAGEACVVGLTRVRRSGGRHGTYAQLSQHALPRGRIGGHLVEIGGVEPERIVGRKRRAGVVATDAVLVQPLSMRRRTRLSLYGGSFWTRRLGHGGAGRPRPTYRGRTRLRDEQRRGARPR